jgi:hypothetical protein
MAITATDFYRSSNGDRWQLIRDTASGRSFVRHEPNLSSGGRTTDTDIDDFSTEPAPALRISRCGRSWISKPAGTGASDNFSDGTAAGKAEAARKSADTTGAATASADRRAAEAVSDTACRETTPSDRGGFCLLI